MSIVSPLVVQINLPGVLMGQREGWYGGAETETWEVEIDRGKSPVRHGKSRRGGEQRGRGRQDGQQRPCRAGGRQKEEQKDREAGRWTRGRPRARRREVRAAVRGEACFMPGQFGPARPHWPLCSISTVNLWPGELREMSLEHAILGRSKHPFGQPEV